MLLSPRGRAALFLLSLLYLTSVMCTLRRLRRVRRLRPRQLTSSTCPRVRPGTPEFFNDITNQEAEPARLNNLYSTGVGPRTTVTAQDFFTDRVPNGRHQFIPQIQQDIGDKCIKIPKCDNNAMFRTIDGSCNNLDFPEWGVTGAALVRLFPAFYADGKHSLRESGRGGPLPNPRKTHLSLLVGNPVPDPVATYAVMTWGQLVSHDTARVIDQQPEGNVAQCLCCSNTRQQLAESLRSRNCVPITVSPADPFFAPLGVTCLNFMRSMVTDDKKCIITPVQFISDVTHYVDASFLYGSTPKVANRLRSFNGGLLRSQRANGSQFLPNVQESSRHCPDSQVCYDAGDDRVNQNPQLSVLQVMFLRLHNQLARQLAVLNPRWSDELLYQHTKRIVSAVFQHITYDEYLPLIISPALMSQLKLTGTTGLVSDQYDKFLNPATVVSFTSAAYRVFHGMIPADVKIFDDQREQIKSFQLSDVFFKPDLIQQNGMFSNFVRGLTFQPAQKLNVAFTKEITNLLFKSNKGLGVDLIAADIMRGRDHGLPGYVSVRVSCGLSKPQNFQGLQQLMPSQAVNVLSQLYKTIEDIDLYIGAVLETRAPNSTVGPTFQCIIAEQFRRWKHGDRYFYTFKNSPSTLSPAQFAEIQKMTLAKIACLVTDVKTMQPQAFKQPNPQSNKIVPCSSMGLMNLQPWVDSNS